MRYLGVSPLEYDELPYYWRERALVALMAENAVENEMNEKAKRGTG